MIAGLELRRQRELGEVISHGFTILLAHWSALAAIAVPAIAGQLAYGLVALLLEDAAGLAVLFGLLTLPVQFALFILVSAAGVFFLDQTDREISVRPADSLDAAQAKLGILIGALARSIGIVFLLFITIVGIPFAIYRLVRWAFISQSIMLDEQQGEAVLAHSAALVQGSWWSTCGRLLAASLVLGLPTVVISQLALLALPGVGGTIIEAATGFVTIPYGIITTTLIFFDLKARKESHEYTGPA